MAIALRQKDAPTPVTAQKINEKWEHVLGLPVQVKARYDQSGVAALVLWTTNHDYLQTSPSYTLTPLSLVCLNSTTRSRTLSCQRLCTVDAFCPPSQEAATGWQPR